MKKKFSVQSKVLLKKIKKCRFAVNFTCAAILLAFTIYTLIPKDEKIDEVNAQKLADSLLKSDSDS